MFKYNKVITVANKSETLKLPCNNLKSIRKQKKWTQNRVCNELKKYDCHISRSTYSKYETGTRKLSGEMLVLFAQCFETSTDCILGVRDYRFLTRLRYCKNKFCVYCFCYQCLLENVSVDENGYCEIGKYIADEEEEEEIRQKKFIRIVYAKRTEDKE